jgi:hypothetical protein
MPRARRPARLARIEHLLEAEKRLTRIQRGQGEVADSLASLTRKLEGLASDLAKAESDSETRN